MTEWGAVSITEKGVKHFFITITPIQSQKRASRLTEEASKILHELYIPGSVSMSHKKLLRTRKIEQSLHAQHRAARNIVTAEQNS
jgi:hypothetical protein